MNDYLNDKGTLNDICKKYNIPSTWTLRQWIKKYTGGNQFKPTSKGKSLMTKGRQTTWTERIEIVQYTLANDKDYQRAVEKYQVSYQQVYQ